MNDFWLDLKTFMYNLELEDHLETFWDFLEEHDRLDANEEELTEAYNQGHEDGYDEARMNEFCEECDD